jgi:hypothetical protein
MRFEIRIDPEVSQLKYEWWVSRGLVESGQGTKIFVIRTSRDDDSQRIDVKVRILGLPENCESVLSDYGTVGPIPDRDFPLVDDFGKLKANDFRGRLDSFLIELFRNPNQKGVIIFSLLKNETIGLNNSRLQLAVNWAKYRKFDINRLVFHFVIDEMVRTRFYRVENSRDISCSKCTTVLGGQVK